MATDLGRGSAPPTLDDLLEWDNLRAAWNAVADSRGAPGADGITIDQFAQYWGADLHLLRDAVGSGAYRPGALRHFSIPKTGGGQRRLHIPNVIDRILQRAMLNVLDPLFEALFLPCSHGYRPGRSLHTALKQILHYRDRGMRWVFDADIDDCFGSISHARLHALLADNIADSRLIDLIDQWARLASPATGRGIAQGMPVSPILCNLYLHQLDMALLHQGWGHVRYADDFVICTPSAADAAAAETGVRTLLASIELQPDPVKTSTTSFDAGFTFLGIDFRGDEWSFSWQGKRIVVESPTPDWVWTSVPRDYPD